MKRFEYIKTIRPRKYSGEREEIHLNDLGNKGWELVNVVKGSFLNHYYFKRQKNDQE